MLAAVRAWWATLGKAYRLLLSVVLAIGLGTAFGWITKIPEAVALFVRWGVTHSRACPSPSPAWFLTWSLSAFVFTAIFLFVFGGILAIDRSHAVRGKKLILRQEVDTQGTSCVTARYEGVSTIHKTLLLPMTVMLPASSDPDVKVTGISAQTAAVPYEPYPKFPPVGGWDGVLKFEDRGPFDIAFTYTFHKNCALDAATYKQRWNEDHAVDSLDLAPHLYWDEIEVEIVWETPPALVKAPMLFRKEALTSAEEKPVRPGVTVLGDKRWVVRLKNVEPRTFLSLRWELK